MKCVLIVDDNKLIRRSLRSLLQDNGWMVCGEAENGRDAITKAQQLHPDRVILDLAMPVMNGLEASRELKSLMSAVPILMFTLFSESELGREAKAAGVDKVIAKSDSPAVLIRSIHGLLAA